MRGLFRKTLVALALAIGYPMLVLAILFSAALADKGVYFFHPEGSMDFSQLKALKRCCGWLLLLLPAGLYFVMLAGSRRKKTVLFLRKFGHRESRRNMYAVLKKTSDRVRLITLDDGYFSSQKLSWNNRIALGLPALAVMAACLLALLGTYPIMFDPDRFSGQDELNQALVFGNLLLSFRLLIVVSGMSFLDEGVQSRFDVQTPTTLAKLNRTFSQMNRWYSTTPFQYPVSTTISVTDELWQQAVIDFLAVADLALLDVSNPSEHIYWEYTQARSLEPGKLVLIADKTSYETWLGQPHTLREETFSKQLEEEDILFYTGGSTDFLKHLQKIMT